MSRRQLRLDLPGLLVPPLTPFDEAGRVDYDRLRAQVDHVLAAARPAAVSVAAVEAQEYQYLPHEQRRELIRRSVEFVDGRAPVVVGVSHPSFRRAAELAHLAEDLGAAAVQVLIPRRPSGGEAGLSELLAYFEAVARETDLPVVAYHNPGPGAEVGPAALLELARLEAVQAFKESSRNMRHVGRLIEAVERPGLARCFTTMEMLLPSLALGGSGGTMPPPGATIAARIVTAFREGRHEEAARLQRIFATFPFRWMGTGGLTAVMKAAMAEIGLDVGDPYPPFAALSADERRELRSFLAGCDLGVSA
jgi:4-hydroxy-tetrahydrodipicolinate synthase